MRGKHGSGRRLGGLALATVAGLTVLSGCQSVAFRMDGSAGRSDQGAAILGLGEATPYVQGVLRSAPAPHLNPRLDPRHGSDNPVDIYAATRTGMVNPAVRPLAPRVYIADPKASGLDAVDPVTYRISRRVRMPKTPQSIVPSWDLKTLWIRTDAGFIPLDPATGRSGKLVAIADARDLLFTPDGRHALVPSGKAGSERVEVRDAGTLRREASIPVPCAAPPGRADFSADGSYAIVTCPGDGRLVRIDPADHRLVDTLHLDPGAKPQDIRLSPDGTRFYVADPASGGIWLIDAVDFSCTGFIALDGGASALALSRDGGTLYASGQRTLSLIALPGDEITAAWPLPEGEIDGVSDDGSVLWLTGRSSGTVYAVSTSDGHILHREKTGARASLLFPQPGRYSLGPTLR